MLTGQVAEALNQIAIGKDPARRLQLAEDTRRMLQRWPTQHLGYRSSDVREMDSLLEGAISELQTAAGIQRFGFSLVATIEPPTMPLLPDPSPTQSIDQVLLRNAAGADWQRVAPNQVLTPQRLLALPT